MFAGNLDNITPLWIYKIKCCLRYIEFKETEVYVIIYSLREWLCYANCLSHIYLCIYQNSEGDFQIYSTVGMNFNFPSFLTRLSLFDEWNW